MIVHEQAERGLSERSEEQSQGEMDTRLIHTQNQGKAADDAVKADEEGIEVDKEDDLL